MDKVKEEKGYKLDTQLEVEDLQNLVKLFKTAVKGSLNFFPVSSSTCAIAFSTSSLMRATTSSRPYWVYSLQTSVVIVKPGGTGMPRCGKSNSTR